jgi:formylmethanofuran dehydrogenase subunit E
MPDCLDDILERSTARHSHLCPRQGLGARMALAALDILRIEAPIAKPTGLVIVETDGCFADGLQEACGAAVGHRTLRIEDVGKVAATFVNVDTGRAIRLCPSSEARSRARLYAPGEEQDYTAQLLGYQRMPAGELFRVQDVVLDPPLAAILSIPTARSACQGCGEEIINERQVVVNGQTLCRTCAQGSYYRTADGLPQTRPGYGQRTNSRPAMRAGS